MSSSQQKLDELDLLESMYPGMVNPDPDDISRCHGHASSLSSDPSVPPSLQLVLKFTSISFIVTLPPLYPETERPTLRINTSSLSKTAAASLIDECQTVIKDNDGELTLLPIIEMIREKLEVLEEEQRQTDVTETGGDDALCRMWYYAHHIYSREKRTNMMAWSRELGLSGFILPGKPGIILIEGDTVGCREFNVRVRAMNWQLLKLQHEERGLDILDAKFTSFNELIFDVHGRCNNHQDLGQFKEYLNGIGLKDIFTILFKI